MSSFADRVIAFNRSLRFSGVLPKDIRVMNPFREFPETMKTPTAFYKKFYDDNNTRFFILGINPGRFGAGVTGVPFTDTKRLTEVCGIPWQGSITHEPSSVFIYKMIARFGGVENFYARFYINSVCPLGFVKNKNDREINYNYYDQPDLLSAAEPFIQQSLKKQISFGIHRHTCFCLGTGKNYKFLLKLNSEKKYFDNIIPLEHPRYIIQYKSAEIEKYLDKFTSAFLKVS